MRKLIWLGALAALLSMCVPAAAAPAVEAFGDLPHVSYAKLSPDGKRLAVVKPIDGREKVAIYDLTKPDEKPQVVGMDGALAGGVLWKSNDLVIIVFHANVVRKGDKEVRSSTRAISLNLATKSVKLLMYDAPYFRYNYTGSAVADIAADDPDHIYMVEVDRVDVDLVLSLYKVDVTTGSATRVRIGAAGTSEYLMDGLGHMLGHIDQDWDLTNHVIIGRDEVYKFLSKGGADFSIEGLTPGAAPEFVVRRSSSYGTTGLSTWGPAGGFGPALFENPNYDVSDAVLDERTWRVIGASYVDDLPRTKYFDPALQHVQDTLEKAFPGQSVTIQSSDASGTSYVISTQGPKNPPVVSLYTAADHKVSTIEEAYPSLKPADLGDVKPYPYKARDGLDIHAYLTLPPGRAPHNLPTIIFPHGGPEARDSMEFDWWAQFMASRGYAVLQPNFRGSAGYGWNLVAQGDGEWAGKVQFDVQDGVQKLIADGIADPKRICIVGASYGGYMALAGATFSPDLYACAVSFAGLGDLAPLLEEGTSFESEGVSIWKRRIGADRNSALIAQASPANFADKVKIPVLLIHSEKDTTVPIEQSRIEERALKKAGKQVEFVTLDGDDHYLEFADTRTKLLKEIERFLTAHIGN